MHRLERAARGDRQDRDSGTGAAGSGSARAGWPRGGRRAGCAWRCASHPGAPGATVSSGPVTSTGASTVSTTGSTTGSGSMTVSITGSTTGSTTGSGSVSTTGWGTVSTSGSTGSGSVISGTVVASRRPTYGVRVGAAVGRRRWPATSSESPGPSTSIAIRRPTSRTVSVSSRSGRAEGRRGHARRRGGRRTAERCAAPHCGGDVVSRGVGAPTAVAVPDGLRRGGHPWTGSRKGRGKTG